jgi:hypothetical protein
MKVIKLKESDIQRIVKRVLKEQTDYDKTQTTEKDGVTTIRQKYKSIDDPSNPGTQVKGTNEQAKDYFNMFIKTNHPDPPTFEKFQVVWNSIKAKEKG